MWEKNEHFYVILKPGQSGVEENELFSYDTIVNVYTIYPSKTHALTYNYLILVSSHVFNLIQMVSIHIFNEWILSSEFLLTLTAWCLFCYSYVDNDP
jgi:hypothetical protein